MITGPKSKRAGPNSRIHSYPVPKAYQPMAEKYAIIFKDRNFSRNLIDPLDFQEVIEQYATNIRFDLGTLMDIFHCSRSALYALIYSKEFAPYYEAAKEARADLLLKRGVDVSEEAYIGAVNGDVGRDAVNAAKNLANYCMTYAQLISSRYGKKGEEGGLNIQITIPQFSNINGTAAEEKPAVVVDGEVIDDGAS